MSTRRCRSQFHVLGQGAAFLFSVSLTVLVSPHTGHAAKGDCGQPLSSGSGPVATDARRVLTTGVGATTCSLAEDAFDPCICDVNGDGTTNATDALSTLRKAVGQAVTLTCQCGGTTLPPTTTTTIATTTTLAPVTTTSTSTTTTTTTSTTTTTLPGGNGGGVCGTVEISTLGSSLLSVGWNGTAHNRSASSGVSTTLDVLRRCTDSGGVQSTVCLSDVDCSGGDTCEATCDCDDAGSAPCELEGPNGQRRCIVDGGGCAVNADCATGGDQCVHFQGAPQPALVDGIPMCVVSRFEDRITGTFDPISGSSSFQTRLLTRVHLTAVSQLCPTCDTGSALTRQVGASGVCIGDTSNVGKPCIVHAVHADGDTSLDCIPNPITQVAGAGLAVDLNPLTTETVTRTAVQVCSDNPVHPNGQFGGFCTDSLAAGDPGMFEACNSNADCLHCTDDPTVGCSANGDCGSGGTCAAAPDQPIACGYYCHVGFCEGGSGQDPERACFADADCGPGEQCTPGSGGGFGAPNAPQGLPNGCSELICGEAASDACANDDVGRCDGNQNVSCAQDTDCVGQSAGSTCVFTPKPCFEHVVAATGTRSALGGYCIQNTPAPACNSSADCGGTPCVFDAAAPSYAAVIALGGAPATSLNFFVGLPGPGRLELDQTLRLCRCGDGLLGCGERCDDGNNVSGDGCSRECLQEQ